MTNSIISKSSRLAPTGMPNKPPSRLLHLTIRPCGGSCEHFYHFMLGYLLPLAAYLVRQEITDDCIILLRTCGPLDRILRELAMPGLLICEPFTHAGVKELMTRAAWVEADEIDGFDFGHLPADEVQYDFSGIDVALDFLRRRLAPAIEVAAAEIDATWSGRPRVLMIERGEPDPFYQSSLAEGKTSANQRRSIGNHAELAAATAAAYPGFRNLQIETTPLAEQVVWFGLADILVAQHGAALSNIVWMRHGTHVIEIAPDLETNMRDLFSQLSQARCLRYSRLRQSSGVFGPASADELAEMIAIAAASVSKRHPVPFA